MNTFRNIIFIKDDQNIKQTKLSNTFKKNTNIHNYSVRGPFLHDRLLFPLHPQVLQEFLFFFSYSSRYDLSQNFFGGLPGSLLNFGGLTTSFSIYPSTFQLILSCNRVI